MSDQELIERLDEAHAAQREAILKAIGLLDEVRTGSDFEGDCWQAAGELRAAFGFK